MSIFSFENRPKKPLREGEKQQRFDSHDIPKTEIRNKILNGEPLTMGEQINAGRDKVLTGINVNGLEIYSDHAYRAVNLDTLKKYLNIGGVETDKHGDVFKSGENNAGVDWYLGGFAPRYGDYILETPASKDKFTLVDDKSNHLMASHPDVYHIKSEGGTNGISLEEITRFFKLTYDKDTKTFNPEIFDIKQLQEEIASHKKNGEMHALKYRIDNALIKPELDK